MMRTLALALALAVLSAVEASPAAGHCFKVWRYPQAQAGCGVISRVPVPFRRPAAPAGFDLPLPDADPATTALKAAMTWTGSR